MWRRHVIGLVLALPILSGCEESSRSFDFDVPCTAFEAGSCTWLDDRCDFSGSTLEFCGRESAPPSCLDAPDELVHGIVARVPAELAHGLDVDCTLTDHDSAGEPANATVCVYPLDEDACRGPWSSRSSDWDDDRTLMVSFRSSGGATIVVVDADASVCDALTIECRAE